MNFKNTNILFQENACENVSEKCCSGFDVLIVTSKCERCRQFGTASMHMFTPNLEHYSGWGHNCIIRFTTTILPVALLCQGRLFPKRYGNIERGHIECAKCIWTGSISYMFNILVRFSSRVFFSNKIMAKGCTTTIVSFIIPPIVVFKQYLKSWVHFRYIFSHDVNKCSSNNIRRYRVRRYRVMSHLVA